MPIVTKRHYAVDSFVCDNDRLNNRVRGPVDILFNVSAQISNNLIVLFDKNAVPPPPGARIYSAYFYIDTVAYVKSNPHVVGGFGLGKIEPPPSRTDEYNAGINYRFPLMLDNGFNAKDEDIPASYFYLNTHWLFEFLKNGLYGHRITKNNVDFLLELSTKSASSNYIPYIEVTYDDLTDVPAVLAGLSPAGDIVNGDNAVEFTWGCSQEVNEPQSHYEIQLDSGNGWVSTVAKKAGSEHKHLFDAMALPIGSVQWRVRVYTLNGAIASSWSYPASIIVKKKPSAPIVTNVDILPRAQFNWTSVDQQGYRLRLTDGYDTGMVYGDITSCAIPYFLPDGIVGVYLSVVNESGIVSDESYKEFTVANFPREAIFAQAVQANNGVQVSFKADGRYLKFYLLRDGEPIAESTGEDMYDMLCLGRHKYVVRGDLGTRYYTDSPAMTVSIRVSQGYVSAIDSINWVPMRLNAEAPPTHTESAESDRQLVFYQGRAKPVSYGLGFETVTHTLGYAYRTRQEYDRLRALLGKTVIYKDQRGECFIGTLTNISPSYSSCVQFSVSITETDFSQKVSYGQY